jgi:hypothetical protein
MIINLNGTPGDKESAKSWAHGSANDYSAMLESHIRRALITHFGGPEVAHVKIGRIERGRVTVSCANNTKDVVVDSLKQNTS